MKTLKTPSDTGLLFDLEASAWWSTQLSPNALRRLREGWQGIFQRTILALLERPAQALGAGLDEELGRPSKELYAMSGLLLIAEFQDWTIDEAADAWTLDDRALDVTTGCKELRVRGIRAVEVAVSLKVTGWNILAAAKIRGHRARRAARRAPGASGRSWPRRPACRRNPPPNWPPPPHPQAHLPSKTLPPPGKNPTLKIPPPPKIHFCACICSVLTQRDASGFLTDY